MKILSWNCRGLGNGLAVRALLDVQKQCNPEVMFLSETHLDDYRATCLRWWLKLDYKIIFLDDGRKGGLIVFWKREANVQIIYAHSNYIDVRIFDAEKEWRLIGFYGEFAWQQKYLTWQRLRGLNAQHNLPWLVLGDFNEILSNDEKEGGNQRPLRYIQAFQQALNDCSLDDLGYVGDKFTWQRGRIRERLDRGVVNDSWRQLYPDAAIIHMGYSDSDHRPILLDTEYHVVRPEVTRQKRFEAGWIEEKTFAEVASNAWSAAQVHTPGATIREKLNLMHDGLHEWDRRILKKPQKRLRKL